MTECIIPILRVSDLEKSLEYYARKLGFEVTWIQETFAGLERHGKPVMVCQDCQGNTGSYVWIGFHDA